MKTYKRMFFPQKRRIVVFGMWLLCLALFCLFFGFYEKAAAEGQTGGQPDAALAGFYQLSPKATITIIADGDRILFKRTGLFAEELFPKSTMVYLSCDKKAIFTFVKNDQGKITEIILEFGEKVWHCPRVDKPIERRIFKPVADSAEEISLTEWPQGKAKTDQERTLGSLKNEKGLWLMNYVNKYQEMLEKENEVILKKWAYSESYKNGACSLFVMETGKNNLLFGRNFDSFSGALATRCSPVGGYSSIAFTRISDLGYSIDVDLKELPLSQRLGFLFAPFFAADGMNEKGITVALAAVDPPQEVKIDPAKKTVFITRLVREILDHAADVSEAVAIACSFNVIDFGSKLVSHHLLLADAAGNSLVLEYSTGKWQVIKRKNPWQAVTNRNIYNKSEPARERQCERYGIIAREFNRGNLIKNWQGAMEVLRLVAVESKSSKTIWSAVYDISKKEIYLVLNTEYDQVIKLDLKGKRDGL